MALAASAALAVVLEMRRPGVGSPTIMEMTEMRNPTFLAAGTALLLSALAGCGTTPPSPEQAAAWWRSIEPKPQPDQAVTPTFEM